MPLRLRIRCGGPAQLPVAIFAHPVRVLVPGLCREALTADHHEDSEAVTRSSVADTRVEPHGRLQRAARRLP